MPNNKYRTHIHADITDVVRAAAQEWIVLAAHAIAARGAFHVALSGGTTPRALYQCLASAEFSGACDWQRVHIWFGDERTVPPHHPDSNYYMAQEALLRHVPVPLTHIHRMQGEQNDAQQAARAYQAQLAAHMPLFAVQNSIAVPQFDLILLGLGPDGHVASLFPGTPILAERARWVAAVFVEKLNAWRISLTLPVIENARHIMLLVTGASKAEIVGEIFGGSCASCDVHGRSLASCHCGTCASMHIGSTSVAGGRDAGSDRSPHSDIRRAGMHKCCGRQDAESILPSASPTKTSGHYPVEMINPGVAMDWYLDSAAAQYIVESVLLKDQS